MRIISKSTAVTLSAISAVVALSILFSSGANALTSAEGDYLAATNSSATQMVNSTTLGYSLTEELASSRGAVTSAAGQVDTPTTLDGTAADALAADKALRGLNSALASRAIAVKSTKVDVSLLPGDYTAATEHLRAIDARTAAATYAARTALAKLTASHAAVVAAVANHTATIARATAEAKYASDTAAATKAVEAQRAAQQTAQKAAQKAAQRATQAAPGPRSNAAAIQAVANLPTFVSPPVPQSVKDRALAIAATQSSPYSISVRATFVPTKGPDGVWNNGQSAVDAGGQNAIQYSNGWTDVAAHNGNDSIALQLKVGDIVNFSGAISGSYRVSGSIDVSKGGSVSEFSTLGTKMMLQTCYWTSDLMRVVGLVPA